MEELLMRLVLFTVLPLALGAAILLFDRTAVGPVRRAEAFLVPLFLVGVGGSGFADFIANVFISDPAARSLGWEPGSPFQLQVAFASLAIGLLGAVSSEWRGGFRNATMVAVTVFAVGAAVAHFLGIATTGPGRWLLIVSDLAVPASLVWFLLTLRRAEEADPPTIILRGWMIPLRRGSVATGAIVAWGFLLGYPTGQVVALSLGAIVLGTVAFWWFISRATTHRARAAQSSS